MKSKSGGSGSDGKILRDGSHIENGVLKKNVTYETGENKYIYQTNSDGLVCHASAHPLKFKQHDGRLSHNPKTYDKQEGDHAGHIFADLFGGSPELDNLVSQAKKVNQSKYAAIEKKWRAALDDKEVKEVNVDIELHYEKGSKRPVSFTVYYEIDGVPDSEIIKNVNSEE